MAARHISPALLLALASACPRDPGQATPTGTQLVDWKRGPTKYSSGVSLGDDIGPPITDDKTITFRPTDPRNDDLGEVRLSLRLERGDVRVIPNSQGVRPAEQAAAPRKIEVKLLANAGWQISGTCEPALSPLASLGGGRVGVAQLCRVNLQSGEDSGGIHLSLRGDGHIQPIASFGKVELHGSPAGSTP